MASKSRFPQHSIRDTIVASMEVPGFLKMLEKYYIEHGRHDLPWRKKSHLKPYNIAVSEIMLQQTQVSRVIDYYTKWTKEFPTIEALAGADRADVLRAWQGLGYNTRGLRLHTLAQEIVNNHKNKFPRGRSELEALPGIGPYTAGAVRAFVWDEPDVFIETNIRRVILYHFFPEKEGVRDEEVRKVLRQIIGFLNKPQPHPNPPLARGGDRKNDETIPNVSTPRTFYWAMMDYGATLPKIIKHNPNKQSKHYTRQSRFEGSVRQVRSGILKWLLEHQEIKIADIPNMLGIVNNEDKRIGKAVDGLVRDGLVVVDRNKVVLKK